jgi:excisionase family DNA binding protein
VTGELDRDQAARVLNVSTAYLDDLLDEGAIAFNRVGADRVVRLDELLAYKSTDDRLRQANASELAALGQEMGFY